MNIVVNVCMRRVHNAMFFPAYLWDIGPLSRHNWFYFDVGMEWSLAPPTVCIPNMPSLHTVLQ